VASLTAAQIQTKVDLLNAMYDELAADKLTSRSTAGRSHTLRELESVQKQIEHWEKRLDRTTRAQSTFTQGRPTR